MAPVAVQWEVILTVLALSAVPLAAAEPRGGPPLPPTPPLPGIGSPAGGLEDIDLPLDRPLPTIPPPPALPPVRVPPSAPGLPAPPAAPGFPSLEEALTGLALFPLFVCAGELCSPSLDEPETDPAAPSPDVPGPELPDPDVGVPAPRVPEIPALSPPAVHTFENPFDGDDADRCGGLSPIWKSCTAGPVRLGQRTGVSVGYSAVFLGRLTLELASATATHRVVCEFAVDRPPVCASDQTGDFRIGQAATLRGFTSEDAVGAWDVRATAS